MAKKQDKYSESVLAFRAKEIRKDRRVAYDYWHKKGVTENELLQVHRTLAKRTNQRLVRLENAVSKVTGENYASYGAGDIVKEYLAGKGQKGNKKLRFTENAKSFYLLPEDEQTDGQKYNRVEILRDIKKMQDFLLSKSSTVGGQKDIEQKRLNTFGTDKIENGEVVRRAVEFRDNKEFYDFLSSETFKALSETFNSETLVEVYDQARKEEKTHEQIIDALADYRNKENLNVKGLRETVGLKEIQ